MKTFIIATSFMTLMGGLLMSMPAAQAEPEGLLMTAKTTNLYDFTMDDIDGKPVNLGQYKGKALLVVNTASFCGNTPQYTELEAIYEQYHDKGFEILAFPATISASRNRNERGDQGLLPDEIQASAFPLFRQNQRQGIGQAPALSIPD